MSLDLFSPADCSDAEAAGHSSPSIKHCCDMGHLFPIAGSSLVTPGLGQEPILSTEGLSHRTASHCTASVASSNAKSLWTLRRGLKIKLKQYYTKNAVEEKIDWPKGHYSETARPVCRVPEETLELAYSPAAFSAPLQTDVVFTLPVLLCFMALFSRGIISGVELLLWEHTRVL